MIKTLYVFFLAFLYILVYYNLSGDIMDGLKFFNEIIRKLNEYEKAFDEAIKVIDRSRLFNKKFTNPIGCVRDAIYALRKKGEDKGIDFFGDDTYLKYIYIAYLEATVEEMINCLTNIVTYINSDFFSRLIHKKTVDDIIGIFTYDDFLLKAFNPDFIFTYYRLLLQTDGYFDAFKPGMYYKFNEFILKEIESLGLDASDSENCAFIREFVKEIEIELKENNDNIDYDSFDEQLKMMSDKYHVDFISLDKDYGVHVNSFRWRRRRIY